MRPVLPNWSRRPAFIAGLLTAVYLALVLCCVRLQYVSNDDVTIMDFARLGFPVRYMGILLTSLLHAAYTAAPGVGWYAVVLYALNALCLFMWIMLVSQAAQAWWLRAALIVVVLGFYLRHLAFLDYTATSALLCTAGVSWACLMALQAATPRRHFLMPGLVFMLGMVVRPHGVPGALLFTLPLLITTALVCLRERPGAAALRRLALCGLLFLLPSAAEFGLDQAWRAAAATPQQTEYETFNAVRGRIHRLNPNRKQALAQDRTALDASGMSAQDVHRLYDWEFLDERVYTPATLQILLDHAPPLQASVDDWRDALSERLRLRSPFFQLMLLGLPLLLLAWPRHRWALLPALLMPLWYPLFTAGMSLLFIFPSRVEHPFVVAAGLAACVLAARLAPKPASRPLLGAALVTVVLALFAVYNNLWGEASHYDGLTKRADRVQENLDELDRDFPGSVILLQPQWGLPMEMLDPLHPAVLRFQPIQLGWSTYSPRFYRQIAALGVDQGHQLVDALASHDHAYILSQQGWPSRLYDMKAACAPAMTEVRRFPNGIFLYRLQRPADCKP